jgi:hypothetical protein
VHNIALTWQQAGVLTGALLALALGLYLIKRPWADGLVPIARESGVIAGLYTVWQLAGELSVSGTAGAYSKARWIIRVERDWHLPSEASVQRGIDHHPLIVQACNIYYATMHFGALFVFLPWLFVRYRGSYGRIRTTLAITTLVCLLIELIPVAPPRLLPGFVDTAAQYGQSVYNQNVIPAADQLSAMPSVHVAWAVLIAWAVITISPSRWRWLVVLHPILTMYVIAATANHFWLDGVAAVLVLIACAWAQAGVRQLIASRRRHTIPEPTTELVGSVS